MKEYIPEATICIDTGHVEGANRSPCVPAYSEGTQMWALGEMLGAALSELYADVVVKYTRTDINQKLRSDGLEDVVERGNAAAGSDLFVSLHSNASNNEKCDGINYVTVFYPYDAIDYTPEDAQKLAEAAETALYINKVNVQPWHTETRQGSRGDWYGVMRGARAVGVRKYFIIEHGCHTNADNALALLKTNVLTDIAIAEALAIGDILQLTKREYVPGDVNGNGEIDPQDYAMLKRFLLGTYDLTVEQKIRADISGDGHLTSKDYAMIKRKVLGTL